MRTPLPSLAFLLASTALLSLACLSEDGATSLPDPSPSTPGPSSPGPSSPGPSSPEPRPVDPNNLPKSAGSFETAKKWLYEKVQPGHEVTLYCGCSYSADKKVDLASCGLSSLTSSRAGRTEAEHVFPAARIGRDRPCWTETLCTDKSGKPFKGRDCCEEIDPFFETAHNDLHNLYPAVGEINGARGDYDFGMVSGESSAYAGCDVEIDRDADIVEPPEGVRGEIARAYLYMEHTYGLPLSSSERSMLLDWSKSDPPESWEVERNRRITELQGVSNPYIQ